MAKTEFNGFGGIDTKNPSNAGNKAYDISNFRILSDASLQKRSGYRLLGRFAKKIRAIMTGYFGFDFLAYILTGNDLYKYNFSTKALNFIGKVGTDEGEATIFYYVGHVYLIDGQEIYDVKDTEIVPAEGYAPLLGKNWGMVHPGEINEPLNLLTSKVRISYIVDDPPSVFLATLYPVKSVEAMYINGVLADPCDYEIDEKYTTVNHYKLKPNDRVELYLTYADGVVDRSEIVKNVKAAIFGGISNSRVFMWGGENKNIMFSSAYVPYDEFKKSEMVYSGNGALYIPQGYDFNVGDGKHAISAVNRHYDRLLIFTNDETWMADNEACGTEAFPTMRINVNKGCISPLGTAKLGNDPVSVSRGEIVRWTSNTDELDDCNAYSISSELDGLLPEDFFRNAVVHEDRYNRELLFGYANDPRGRVFVYGEDNKQWYIYEGIHADRFFDGPDNIGFVKENSIYLFDKDMEFDEVSTCCGNEINAYYCSYPIDFGYPERKKRLAGFDLVADTNKGTIKVAFCSDNNITQEKLVIDDTKTGVSSYHERLSSERFVRSAIRIDADTNTTQRIYNIAVTIKR